MLNSDQIAFYQKNGFLILENFISKKEIDQLHLQSLKIIYDHGKEMSKEIFQALQAGISQEMHYFNKQSDLCIFFNEKAFLENGDLKFPLELAVTKISHALHDIDPVFSKFSRQVKIAKVVSDLGLVDPYLVQSMMIFKHAKTGKEISCHQDGTFIYTEPDTTIGLWFALEDTTIENGCLFVIPEGHFSSLKYRYIMAPGRSMNFITLDDTPWELDKMIPLEVPKGSLIILHSRIPHMSKANISSNPRPAYTLHLVDALSRYSSENWLQRSDGLPFKSF